MTDDTIQLSPHACRAARELLSLSQEELARLAQISVTTLRRFELAREAPSDYAARQLYRALEQEGVMFISGKEPSLK